MLIPSLLVSIGGILLIKVGLYVRKKEKTSFIAGHRQLFHVRDEKKLASRIGWVVVLFGIETVLFPIIFQLIPRIDGTVFLGLAMIHLAAVFVVILADQLSQ